MRGGNPRARLGCFTLRSSTMATVHPPFIDDFPNETGCEQKYNPWRSSRKGFSRQVCKGGRSQTVYFIFCIVLFLPRCVLSKTFDAMSLWLNLPLFAHLFFIIKPYLLDGIPLRKFIMESPFPVGYCIFLGFVSVSEFSPNFPQHTRC